MNAKEAHRKAIESQYTGKCTVTEMQGIKDPVTNILKQTAVVVLTDQPCKMTHKSSDTTTVVNGVAVQSQSIKLLISPDIEIKPGSKVTITQDGRTADFKRSGLPAVYPSHQEISLVIFDKFG